MFLILFFSFYYVLDTLFWLAHKIPNPGQGSRGLFSFTSNLPVNSFEVGVAAIVIHEFQNKKK